MKVSYQFSDEDFSDVQDPESLWIRFDMGQNISAQTKTYKNSTESKISPLASKIFGFPWVEEIKISPQALLIKRQSWVDFDIICEPLKELIEEHFKNAGPQIEENPEPPKNEDFPVLKAKLSDEERSVVDFLNQNINPQIATHGGRISLVKIENGFLYVKMEGGCQGCSMAQATLKEGVEMKLKENFGFISEVIDVTEHDQGLRPFL